MGMIRELIRLFLAQVASRIAMDGGSVGDLDTALDMAAEDIETMRRAAHADPKGAGLAPYAVNGKPAIGIN